MKAVAKTKTVTGIIAGALELFTRGPNGEKLRKARWNNHSLSSGDNDGNETYCALGALSQAANGLVSYSSEGNLGKAKDLVASCIPARYNVADDGDIPGWNDSLSEKRGFTAIKRVFCKALKKSIELERKGKRRKVTRKGK